MKVESSANYRLIFSISNHPFLGVIIEPFVVEHTPAGTLSLTYQKVFSGNSSYYTKLSENEHELIKLLDGIMPETIVKKFSPEKKIRPKEYFKKHFKKAFFKSTIRPYIEAHLENLLTHPDASEIQLYRADEINPAAFKIEISTEFTKVLFHFRKNENGTSYFVTLKYDNEKVMFMKQNGLLICHKPAFLVVNRRLYKFYDFVDGSKLAVFLNKKYIHIKPESEKHYYETYIKKLLETAPVYAEGFDISTHKEEAIPCLTLIKSEDKFLFQFQVKYDNHIFNYRRSKQFHVLLEWNENLPHFKKFKCSRIWESNKIRALGALELHPFKSDYLIYNNGDLYDAVMWMRDNHQVLKENGFEVYTSLHANYSILKPTIHYTISDKIDWFDVNIVIKVGEFEIPFAKIVKLIKQGKNEYILPNDEVFIVLKEWFKLGESLQGSKEVGGHFHIKKYQLDILNFINSKKIKDHLSHLVDIRSEKPSKKLKGKLRKYQLDGLSWLMFLSNNSFGGILADDMGLGKTLQTLSFLQLLKEKSSFSQNQPYLLISPTSLLFNWEQEIKKFTPDISYEIHAGPNRSKTIEGFPRCDLIITSYGLIRNDYELFSNLEFQVLILDESQHIKNHKSKTAKHIGKLNARTRIALTGTPIENSIVDLWSQMNFLNPGLLGTLSQFESKFVKPIEKEGDKESAKKLQYLVKPFLLRRTKNEVAKELPPITEKVIYCDMEAPQEKMYEEIKSEYRNSILNIVEQQGFNKSKLSILQGLTKLRQIANHPKLADPSYQHSSGKHEQLLSHISTAIEEKHKILVFSQYVSYLKIIEEELKERQYTYLMLTGSTSKSARAKRVEEFQNNHETSIFLISLKAGGTGLNLTAADYVFLVDPWWNPAAEAQARDRTHRIGQSNNVFSYKFISRNTIEEKIIKLQKKKQTYSKDIIKTENNILKNLDLNDINILLS